MQLASTFPHNKPLFYTPQTPPCLHHPSLSSLNQLHIQLTTTIHVIHSHTLNMARKSRNKGIQAQNANSDTAFQFKGLHPPPDSHTSHLKTANSQVQKKTGCRHKNAVTTSSRQEPPVNTGNTGNQRANQTQNSNQEPPGNMARGSRNRNRQRRLPRGLVPYNPNNDALRTTYDTRPANVRVLPSSNPSNLVAYLAHTSLTQASVTYQSVSPGTVTPWDVDPQYVGGK